MKFPAAHDRIDSLIALVVEDDAASRARVAGFLRAKGYGVLEASTSLEALLLAVDFPDRIDALFTCTRLRKYCNGAELAACLRASRPEIAVFYLEEAGSPNEEVTRELIQGQAVLIGKPVTTPRLQEAVDLIDERRAWVTAPIDRVDWI